MFNVYYRNTITGRTCRYCVSGMIFEVAEQFRDRFNSQYPNMPFPNGKGYYPYSLAWVDRH